MSANFEEKLYIDSTEDIMLLSEKVQLFAQQHGWEGDLVTFELALAAQDKNILDYTRSYFEATQYMNENHNPFQTPTKGNLIMWDKTPDGDGWGLINYENFCVVEINKQEENAPPIT